MSFRSFRYQSFDRDDAAVSMRASELLAGTELLSGDACDLQEPAATVHRQAFEAGRAQGLAEGREAALREAEAELAHRLPETLRALDEATTEARTAKHACEHDALLLVRAVLQQLLPKLAERTLSLEVAAQVADVIAGTQAPSIEIRCAQKTRDVVKHLCGAMPTGVELVCDPALTEGSMTCAWTDGGARFDGKALTEAVVDILDRCLSEAEHAELGAREPEQDQKED